MLRNDMKEIREITKRPRLPYADRDEIEAIDRFLVHMLDCLHHALNDHQALFMTHRDKRLEGVVNYQKNQVQTLKMLIANNLQRMKRGTTTGPRRKRGA